MEISKICNLLVVIFVFKTSLAIPFESNNVNEFQNEQLTQRWIFDRFSRLENEISYLKARNYEQDQEIRQLKQKNAAFESSGSSPIDTTGVLRKEDSVDYSSLAIPAAAITVGPMDCSGLNLNTGTKGFYIVRNPTDRMKVVYCEKDSDTELDIGNLDIKTQEVHFYVQRNEPFSDEGAIIKFTDEQLNIGGGMDFLRGVFNAPVSGTYHFSFSGIKDSATSTSLKIQLLHNYEPIGLAYAPNLNSFLGLSTINVSLRLKKGDNVALFKVGPGTLYDSDTERYTHFTGWLEQEDLDV